ncbi:unnamed protein product [Periconia digitata]|uniref:Uncharacterized protein n=1 Tax=Periconia digitata TaxID=1303443 RepID=A0A9W4UNT3_9PLEO|nr:unnamed protein product [Periconia digitata]
MSSSSSTESDSSFFVTIEFPSNDDSSCTDSGFGASQDAKSGPVGSSCVGLDRLAIVSCHFPSLLLPFLISREKFVGEHTSLDFGGLSMVRSGSCNLARLRTQNHFNYTIRTASERVRS